MSDEFEYCTCCGELLADIRKNIAKQTVKTKIGSAFADDVTRIEFQEYRGHKIYKENSTCYKKDIIYPAGQYDFCPVCGTEIDDEYVNGEYEDRGECHGAPCREYVAIGYECQNCGYEDKF